MIRARAALLVAFLLAAPATALRLGNSDAGNNPPGQTTRQAYDLLAQGFGPGFNGPLVVAVAMPGPAAEGTVEQLRTAIANNGPSSTGGYISSYSISPSHHVSTGLPR